MAGQSFAMFGLSWTEVSVLGSQEFGQASIESCDGLVSLNSSKYAFKLDGAALLMTEPLPAHSSSLLIHTLYFCSKLLPPQ